MPCTAQPIWRYLVAVAALAAGPASAQELEPRLMSNVPRGTNFAIVGYGFAKGNILLDPSIPIEDLDSQMHSLVAAYVRSIALFGQAGKIDAVVPFAAGDWRGRLSGQDTTRVIDGFGDPRIRLSWNSFGSPSLSRAEFREYRQSAIVGASVQVFIPLGQYDPTKLINLGTNRWTFRPQLGVSQAVGSWLVEAYASAWFFTTNSNFFNGSTLTQQPLFAGKVHIIRLLPKGFWVAIDGGYGIGGRTAIDGEPRDTRISSFRFGATVAVPLARQHTLKFVLASGARIERGPDFDAVAVTYQFRWGGS